MSDHTAEKELRTRFGVWVQGECPTCGVRSLFVGSGGYLTCGNLSCSRPWSPSEALGVTFPEARVTSPSRGSAEEMDLIEEGRRLASRRDDLIAEGIDPADLEIPLLPPGMGHDS